MAFVGRLADFLWNPWLLGLFLWTGLVYSVKSGFFQLFGAPVWWRETIGSLFRRREGRGGGLSSLQALATALASTMGTGSIAGVAAALSLGGPGAVFWMWLSALLGMMTSFGEKLLAVRYQQTAPGGELQGGPMFYLRDGVGSSLLAKWFALACLLATFAGGNLIQASSIAASLKVALEIPRPVTGAAVALLTGLAIAGGMGRIAQISSALVPAMALLYLGGGLTVLACRAGALPGAFRAVFVGAFTPAAALGGGAGWTVSAALRYGVARGVFTNEAGLGTSAIAHGAARAEPARQGMWGIFEVFLSTLVVCTVTALVILTSGLPVGPDAPTGVSLTAAAFARTLGGAGEGIVALSLLLFAFSSILGWSYYGRQCLGWLAGGRQPGAGYQAAFLVCTFAGAVWEPAALWQLVDLCNALMALPNLAALLLLAPEAMALLQLSLRPKEPGSARKSRWRRCRIPAQARPR